MHIKEEYRLKKSELWKWVSINKIDLTIKIIIQQKQTWKLHVYIVIIN